MTLEGIEALGLYLFLKSHEDELDEHMNRVLHRLERRVYDLVSLEELAQLPEMYANGVNVLDREDRS